MTNDLVGERVFVYRNLNTGHIHGRWSAKSLTTGRVIARGNTLLIDGPVEFRVGQKTCARVRAEKRKRVHAGVVGRLVRVGGLLPDDMENSATREVTFNPYGACHFQASFGKVTTAKRVFLGEMGVWAMEPEDAS